MLSLLYRFSSCLGVACVLVLTSCSSKKAQQPGTPLMSQNMESRWKRPDMTRRSVYDPNAQASFGGKTSTGGWLAGQQYGNAAQFGGANQFRNGKERYSSKEYANAKSAEHLRNQSFGSRDKESALANDQFGTSSSSFDGQQSNDASKGFASRDNKFSTSNYGPTERSLGENNKPKIIDGQKGTQGGGKPAYSEDEVKQLLGR